VNEQREAQIATTGAFDLESKHVPPPPVVVKAVRFVRIYYFILVEKDPDIKLPFTLTTHSDRQRHIAGIARAMTRHRQDFRSSSALAADSELDLAVLPQQSLVINDFPIFHCLHTRLSF
jgi:hypothetical protein